MPERPFTRDQHYLLPPSFDEWIPSNHRVRFVADLVASFDAATLAELEIDDRPSVRGAPRFSPLMLLMVWIYGYMDGRRSTRALERACQTDLAYLWLTGNQQPDHNTLHRFYQQHRQTLRRLFRKTVEIVVATGQVDWALQAVDGTKIVANASVTKSLTAEQVTKLLELAERAIADLEAQAVGDETETALLPEVLQDAEERRARIAEALDRLQGDDPPAKVNLTDPDAQIMRTRQGELPGYNAQAVIGAVETGPGEPEGRVILATEVTTDANDEQQLPPMLDLLEATTGQLPDTLVADAGYCTSITLGAVAGHPVDIVMPLVPPSHVPDNDRFPQAAFAYDPASDTFVCPNGAALTFRGIASEGKTRSSRRYRARLDDCRTCPLRHHCLPDKSVTRELRVVLTIAEVHAHRERMALADVPATMARRRTLAEPVFGIVKEALGARRFLRRGLEAVRSEWYLTASAFNLNTAYRLWGAGKLTVHPLR